MKRKKRPGMKVNLGRKTFYNHIFGAGRVLRPRPLTWRNYKHNTHRVGWLI